MEALMKMMATVTLIAELNFRFAAAGGQDGLGMVLESTSRPVQVAVVAMSR